MLPYLQVDDEDDSSFIYSITAGDEGVFTVIGNTIVLLQKLDYETKATYNITVEATDSRDEPQTVSNLIIQPIDLLYDLTCIYLFFCCTIKYRYIFFALLDQYTNKNDLVPGSQSAN